MCKQQLQGQHVNLQTVNASVNFMSNFLQQHIQSTSEVEINWNKFVYTTVKKVRKYINASVTAAHKCLSAVGISIYFPLDIFASQLCSLIS